MSFKPDGKSFFQENEECNAILKAGSLDNAAQAFEQLVAKWPGQIEAWTNLGYVYVVQGRVEEAVQALERGVELNPLHVGARLNLLVAYREAKQMRYVAELSFGLIADTHGNIRQKTIAILVDSLKQLNDVDLIHRTAGRLANEHPDDPEVSNAALTLYFKAGDHDSCIHIYRERLSKSPSKLDEREKLAFHLFLAGHTQEAQQEFEILTADLGVSDPDALRFHELYNAALTTTRTEPLLMRRARFQSLVRAFQSVIELDGEVAECGMYRGLSALLLCTVRREHDAQYSGADFHGFDSFEGLSTPQEEDQLEDDFNPSLNAGAFECSIENVRQNLSSFPQVQLYKGWIPERFHEVSGRQFKFVNVDVDLYQPSKDALEFFFPRLVEGGVVVCDDYNWAGQARAVNEFCQLQNLKYKVTEHKQAIIRRL